MIVEDRRTGKKVRIQHTDEMREQISAIYADCQHPDVQLRQIPQRGGSVRIQELCLVCGTSIGQALKKSSFEELPPVVDFDVEKFREEYDRSRQRRYDDLIQKAVEEQVERNSKTSRRYEEYLRSPEWKAKRQKVLARAKHVCEGCLEAPAEEIHHLSYDNFGDELLFQLVALCRPCHAKCFSILDELNGEPSADDNPF